MFCYFSSALVRGESLRRAIEVVKGRAGSGKTGLAMARRDSASAERRRSIVGAMMEESWCCNSIWWSESMKTFGSFDTILVGPYE